LARLRNGRYATPALLVALLRNARRPFDYQSNARTSVLEGTGIGQGNRVRTCTIFSVPSRVACQMALSLRLNMPT
jgi:hypothetical protein